MNVLRNMLVFYAQVFVTLHWRCQKKSFKSADIKRAPLEASEIMLFRRIFVSSTFAAGEPASDAYVSLSPPNVMRTRCGYVLSGR